MAIDWGTVLDFAEPVLGFAGGLLDDSDEMMAEAQKTGGRYAYPGQKKIASMLSPYLWESLGTGLTKEEKSMYRGAGKTSIMQGIKSARNRASSTYASQGLRGGRVADVLTRIDESAIPAMAKLETDIMSTDIGLKRKRISDILQFLGLTAGYGENTDISSSNSAPAKDDGGTPYGSMIGSVAGSFLPIPGGSIIGSIIGGLFD